MEMLASLFEPTRFAKWKVRSTLCKYGCSFFILTLGRGEDVYEWIEKLYVCFLIDILIFISITMYLRNFTVAGLINTRFGGPPIPFICNRPFIFFIRDKFTGITLFAGNVINTEEMKSVWWCLINWHIKTDKQEIGRGVEKKKIENKNHHSNLLG